MSLLSVPLTYYTAVQKGRRLLDSFAQRLAQSQYIHYSQLDQYGWEIAYRDENVGPRVEETEKLHMYNDLGISTRNADNLQVCWKHKATSEPWGRYGRAFEPTDGFYSCIYNPRAIVAQYSSAPWNSGERFGIRGEDIIPLNHWSDIVFLQWKQYCYDRVLRMDGLRYVLRSNVTNGDTIDVVDDVASSLGLDLRRWDNPVDDPGVRTFPVDTEQGMALLGTPNGAGVVYLLTQHREAFGYLMIEAITVFIRQTYGVASGSLNLVFHLAPGPRPSLV